MPLISLALLLSFGLPSIKQPLTCCRPARATKLEHNSYKQRLKELGLLRLEETRLLGDISRYLCGAYREDGVILFSEVHSKTVRSNSHMLQEGKFGLDKRKGVFHKKHSGWLSTVPGCTGRLQNLQPHRCSKHDSGTPWET